MSQQDPPDGATPQLPIDPLPAPRRVVVIGGGILGVSAAYHLAARGVAVEVVERTGLGAGATQGAFAMLIAVPEQGPGWLYRLYAAAVQDWRRLEAELPGAFAIQWGGALSWAEPGGAANALVRQGREAVRQGAAVRAVQAADLTRLIAGLAPGPVGAALFSPDHGALDPVQACEALRSAALAHGARWRAPAEVEWLRRHPGGGVTLALNDLEIEADVVVLAAGAGTALLAAQLGVRIPLDNVSGALAYSRPVARTLGRVLNGPLGSLKQDDAGRIVCGPDYTPGARATGVDAAYGRELLANARRMLPDLPELELERMSLGHVPLPIDRRPIAGFAGPGADVYVLATMSGVTFAPVLGRFAAIEILDGAELAPLENCRPSRFNS